MIHRHVPGQMFRFPRIGMRVGTGARELLQFLIGSPRLEIGNSGSVSPDPSRLRRDDRNDRVRANVPSPGDSRRTAGTPSDRGQVAGPTAGGALGGDGPEPTQ